MKKIINLVFVFTLIFFGWVNFASADEMVDVYVFEREDCNFCKLEEKFLEEHLAKRNDLNVVHLDVDNFEIKEKFNKLTKVHGLQKATPITLVGDSIIQGFNSNETTGQLILSAIDKQKGNPRVTLEDYLIEGKILSKNDAVCDDSGDNTLCTIEVAQSNELQIPIIGVINYKDFSLLSISVILGFVDGFNPCAMWVLLTFLLILWQVGDKRKMWQMAGLFIFAETIMYWAILNFWFGAWDFIGLDRIVTPVVGLLAVGGGIYFLTRYFKNRGELVCDVKDYQSKSKTEQKIKDLINSPLTVLTVLGIMGVAFSVNIIEFACSIGIPQAFTKILEINNLGLIKEQFYIFVYTFFYMIDDFVVFGLALYGFDKFYTVGQKYSNLSSLIGGILMLILGALLLFNPSVLVF